MQLRKSDRKRHIVSAININGERTTDSLKINKQLYEYEKKIYSNNSKNKDIYYVSGTLPKFYENEVI